MRAMKVPLPGRSGSSARFIGAVQSESILRTIVDDVLAEDA